MEEFIPDQTASNVKYFGPGEHSPDIITLNDNDILYIAGGALVYGGIRLNGSSNIKVISFGNSGDGINPVGSGNMTINNCMLVCTDDCVAIKSPDSTRTIKNIKISNNTFIGFAFADAVTIGFETNGPVRFQIYGMRLFGWKILNLNSLSCIS